MNLLNNITVQDVRLFFSSKCCTKIEESSGTDSEESSLSLGSSCQNSPQLKRFFAGCNKQNLFAVTITIGNKFYGKMSYKDQYKCMKRAIADLKRFESATDYYFTFELTKNGQLHSHGLVHNLYQAAFGGIFGKFGSRNKHPKSFEPLGDLDSYWDYINKECICKSLHNITKNKIKNKLLVKSRASAGSFILNEAVGSPHGVGMSENATSMNGESEGPPYGDIAFVDTE